MGAKKQRVKAAVQAFVDPSPEPPQDDTLLDDLLSQLDSPNPTVQQESAVVLNEVQRERVTETVKKSSKTRFKEREVRLNSFYRPSSLMAPLGAAECSHGGQLRAFQSRG
jgi:hypothetical protein